MNKKPSESRIMLVREGINELVYSKKGLIPDPGTPTYTRAGRVQIKSINAQQTVLDETLHNFAVVKVKVRIRD